MNYNSQLQQRWPRMIAAQREDALDQIESFIDENKDRVWPDPNDKTISFTLRKLGAGQRALWLALRNHKNQLQLLPTGQLWRLERFIEFKIDQIGTLPQSGPNYVTALHDLMLVCARRIGLTRAAPHKETFYPTGSHSSILAASYYFAAAVEDSRKIDPFITSRLSLSHAKDYILSEIYSPCLIIVRLRLSEEKTIELALRNAAASVHAAITLAETEGRAK